MIVMNEKMIRMVVEQEAFEKEYQDHVKYVEHFEKMMKMWESYYYIKCYKKSKCEWHSSNT